MGAGMGMGKTKVDSRWRITLPASTRGNLRPGDEVIVEEQGNLIIIRKATNVLEEFRKIKLYIENENLIKANASIAKHVYGAIKE